MFAWEAVLDSVACGIWTFSSRPETAGGQRCFDAREDFGALAGTVELESADPGAQPAVAASAAYGSRDSLDTRASAMLRRGSGFATLSAAYARGDGFVPTVAESRGPADRPAPYEQA